jgi:hypothetical protein
VKSVVVYTSARTAEQRAPRPRACRNAAAPTLIESSCVGVYASLEAAVKFVGTIGEGPKSFDDQREDQIREFRLASARHCKNWTEIDSDELVERDRGRLVHAGTDEVFERYGGDAFSRSGQIIADWSPLHFYVTPDRDVVVLERLPRTWSQMVYERERAAAR